MMGVAARQQQGQREGERAVHSGILPFSEAPPSFLDSLSLRLI
jgi:hypothetical protein